MTKVSVIILNWNGQSNTRSVLADINKLDKSDIELEVVVVDNNSSESVNKIKNYKALKNYTFIQNPKNLGYAGGNNVGIKHALKNGADYVLVINNDIILDKKLLVAMLMTCRMDVKVGMVSPKIYFAKGFEFHKDNYTESDRGNVIWYAGGKIDWDNVYGINRGVDELDIGQYNNASQTGFATGTCILISRETVEKVGMFDKRYYLYYEDTDLSVRVKKSGYKIMYQPEAVIWHKVSQSSGIGSDLNDYFIHRNRLLFGFKYASTKTKLALLRESFKFLLTGRKWQRKGVLDYYLRRFGKGSWK